MNSAPESEDAKPESEDAKPESEDAKPAAWSQPGTGPGATWKGWRSNRALVAVLVFIAVASAAAVIGLVMLWPTGEGRGAIRENADKTGIAYQRLTATVTAISDRVCNYAVPDDPQVCRTIHSANTVSNTTVRRPAGCAEPSLYGSTQASTRAPV